MWARLTMCSSKQSFVDVHHVPLLLLMALMQVELNKPVKAQVCLHSH